MRRTALTLVWVSVGLLALATVPSTGRAAPNLDDYRKQARVLVQQFANAIRDALQTAIDAGDVGRALRVCKTIAPEITQTIGKPGDWRVRRTALRVRNPDNAPTREEKAVLTEFQARADRGEKLSGMESMALARRLDKPVFHYMQAIPLGELCAQCHGTKIDPDLALLIQALYPEDRATGFEIGELRGAYTLYKALP